MTSAFTDHFSGVSPDYARFRPRYPEALFDHLAALAPGRELAWDCATGSGQAAVPLAGRFARVVATDASAAQLAHAESHPHIEYRVTRAEESGLESRSVDLITVAQALHWLELPLFHAEVKRVLRPGGVVAAWCYARLVADDGIQGVLDHFYDEVVGPHWPAERRLVEDGYRSLEFPFRDLRPPTFTVEAEFTLSEFGGYLRTWSATQRYTRAHAEDPVPPLLRRLEPLWGGFDRRRTITWPLALRIGVHEAGG
jgi:SAM-dependent methyltransferase